MNEPIAVPVLVCKLESVDEPLSPCVLLSDAVPVDFLIVSAVVVEVVATVATVPVAVPSEFVATVLDAAASEDVSKICSASKVLWFCRPTMLTLVLGFKSLNFMVLPSESVIVVCELTVKVVFSTVIWLDDTWLISPKTATEFGLALS